MSKQTSILSDDLPTSHTSAPVEQLPAVQSASHVPAVAPPAIVSGHTANVLALIQSGMEKGSTPEALSQLVALYERVIARDAKAEFDRAKKSFQSECPVIGKNRTANLGEGKAKYNFADLEHITRSIRPLLERHGFTYSFSQSHDKDIVTVVCILKHEAGHEEHTPFSGPWATNAGMSAIQKYASATTFCQRYALRLALGLPVGDDTDGRGDEHEGPSQRNDAPNIRPRGEQLPENGVSGEMMRALCARWKTWARADTFDAAAFSKAVRKLLEPAPSDPMNASTWSKAQYEATVEAMQ